MPDIAWHGTKLGSPGFDDPQGRALACTIAGFEGDADLHVMMNMFWDALDFELPVDPQRTWNVAVDTLSPGPGGMADEDQPFGRPLCTVRGRSIVILVGIHS